MLKLYEEEAIRDIANAIRTTTGTNGAFAVDEMANAILLGDKEVESKDVDFYDYDGTRLYSYTLDEIQSLSELPPLPSHDGLITQEWNWTLDELKSANHIADVGAIFITDDGKTRFYVTIPEENDEREFCLDFSISKDGSVSVDWGDETTPEVFTSDANNKIFYLIHTYSSSGDYIITVDILANPNGFGFNSGSYKRPMFSYEAGYYDANNRFYRHAKKVKKIEIGSANNGNMYIGQGAFKECYYLETITVPNGISILDGYAFENTKSLKHINIPRTVTQTNGYCFKGSSLTHFANHPSLLCGGPEVFNSCNLERVVITGDEHNIGNYLCLYGKRIREIYLPEGITNIGNQPFSGCLSLYSLTIPSTCVSLGNYFVHDMDSLRHLRFMSEVPPTAPSTSTFNMPADLIIHIPHGTLEAYTTATNYPDPSVYTYVEDL